MSSKFASWAAGGFAAFALATASAQPAPATDVAARIVATCTPEGAFGASFGDTLDLTSSISPEGWAPIETITAFPTPRSGRLQLVKAYATFPDQAAAQAFLAALEAQAVASGRFTRAGERSGAVVLERRGVRLELRADFAGSDIVYINCVNPELHQLAGDELMGRAAARPVVPQLQPATRAAPGVCEDPAARGPFLDAVREKLETASQYSSALTRYPVELLSWYDQQLRDKGAWSAEDTAAFRRRLLQNQAFARPFARSVEVLAAFVERRGASREASESDDQGRACAAALTVLDDIDQLTELSQAQWRAIEEMYRAEARRHSLTLD